MAAAHSCTGTMQASHQLTPDAPATRRARVWSTHRARPHADLLQARCSATQQASDVQQQSSSPAKQVVQEYIFRPWGSGNGGRQALDTSRHWRIRRYSSARDYQSLLQLQVDSFFTPPKVPLPGMSQLAYVNFKAEVADGLRKKEKTLDEDSFIMYILEDISRDVCRDQLVLTTLPATSWERLSVGPAAASGQDQGLLEYTVVSSASSQDTVSDGAQAASQQQQQSQTLTGTVEVTCMDEAEVITHLPRAQQPWDQYAYISSMTVAKAARRQGLAQALLHVAERQSRAWGQLHLALHVYEDNTPAIALYEKTGFQTLAKDAILKRMLGGRVRHLMHKLVDVK